jgi:hypothetical protein
MSNQRLAEFTPARELSANPEHQSKHELTQWLKAHGAGVLWEEANQWDHPTFSIEREFTGGRPDLLVLIGGRRFVIEYKTGESVGEIYDALPQLLRYWREHVNNSQTYLAGGTPINVDGFLTASSHSPAGRLFPRYAEKRQDHVQMSEGRQDCYQERGELPPAEYRMTEQHIRTMWRMVKQFDNDSRIAGETPHVGALLSNALSTPATDPKPAVLWNRTRNNQDWEVLD